MTSLTQTKSPHEELEAASQLQQDNPAEEVPFAQPYLQLQQVCARGSYCFTQASQMANINFLTAKTILFFHKNNYKTYQFNLRFVREVRNVSKVIRHAGYTLIRKLTNLNEKLIKPKTRMEVVCSIGNVLSPLTKSMKSPKCRE